MSELAILSWLVVVSVGDLRTRRIPNALVWPPIVAVTAMGAAEPPVLLAACAASAPYLHAFRAGTCGGGDVKLAYVCGGLATRWDAALVMVAAAAILALVAALAARRSRHGQPHAPALALALIAVSDPLG